MLLECNIWRVAFHMWKSFPWATAPSQIPAWAGNPSELHLSAAISGVCSWKDKAFVQSGFFDDAELEEAHISL